jgi:glycosyltransferase involved in cell wall biosynthesis
MPGVASSQLESLYQYAEALVLPTLYEGFGFPVLEAMRMGTAVITSDFGAVKEISGTAALTVDTRNPSRIAEAIERLQTVPDLKKNLQQEGLKQSSRFTWENTAQATLEVYRRTLHGN